MYTNIDYAHLREVLCVERNEEGLKKRQKMFSDFDPNGNGFLSLAEVDKGIRDVLRLPEIFALKRVIMRAFQAAKDSTKNKHKNSSDYIERNEFRYFLCYLRQYFEYYEMFDLINTDDDKYIDFDEFVASLKKLETWGIKVTDPEKTFNQIDIDKGGRIRFDEFCEWAIKCNLDIDTDDDFEDSCLSNLK
jgi:Ca2+-binding EF-hand superfamily protein